MGKFDYLVLTINDHIASVVLNRPDKANALHIQCWEEIAQVFTELDLDPAIRVIILSGQGKHFCSGIDLSVLQSLAQNLPSELGRRCEVLREKILKFQSAFNKIDECRKPVIAMIHGACLGGGLDMIAACDLRYSTRDAQFALREVDMGMVADVGSLQRLPKILNEAFVRELAYTGKTIDGLEAERVGLVNRVFNDYAELAMEVTKIAKCIAEKSPLVIRNTKAMFQYAQNHSIRENLEYIATVNSAMLLSDDLQKAVQAFLTKQPTNFLD